MTSNEVLVVIHGSAHAPTVEATARAIVDETPSAFALGILDCPNADKSTSASALPSTFADREVLFPARGDDGPSLQSVLRRVPQADVVFVRAGVRPRGRWLEHLQEVAYSDSVYATASAFVKAGLEGYEASGAQQRVAAEGAPTLSRPALGCVYVRRDALDLALGNRTGPEPQSDSSTWLSDVLSMPGLVHKLDPSVVVQSEETPPDTTFSCEDLESPAVARGFDRLAFLRGRLSVMVDARCLDQPPSGTQVQILHLITALAETGEIDLHLFLPRQVHPSLASSVDAVSEVCGLYTVDRLPAQPMAVVHRPHQIYWATELDECLRLGRRLVITHQDMIMARTPAYFPSREAWAAYRTATYATWLAADRVAFFSKHAAADALSDGVLAPNQVSVVPLGTDHLANAMAGPELAPSQFASGSGAPFLLVLGNAFVHKNRMFAIRLLHHLRTQRGWNGSLVLAGEDPRYGSSVTLENEYIEQHEELKGAVVDLGQVAEAEKRWLYRSAALVLFPTLYEGFGFVPFEAAEVGTPCLYASRSSLAEFLPSEGALLDGWDVEHAAEGLLQLLEDKRSAASLCSAIREAGRSLTWARTAQGYLDVYRQTIYEPVKRATAPLTVSWDSTRESAAVSITSHDEVRLVAAYRHSRAFRSGASATIRVGSLARRLLRSAGKRGVSPS
jgi:glycosyltransferase involved in cell wall biosynthesis